VYEGLISLKCRDVDGIKDIYGVAFYIYRVNSILGLWRWFRSLTLMILHATNLMVNKPWFAQVESTMTRIRVVPLTETLWWACSARPWVRLLRYGPQQPYGLGVESWPKIKLSMGSWIALFRTCNLVDLFDANPRFVIISKIIIM